MTLVLVHCIKKQRSASTTGKAAAPKETHQKPPNNGRNVASAGHASDGGLQTMT